MHRSTFCSRMIMVSRSEVAQNKYIVDGIPSKFTYPMVALMALIYVVQMSSKQMSSKQIFTFRPTSLGLGMGTWLPEAPLDVREACCLKWGESIFQCGTWGHFPSRDPRIAHARFYGAHGPRRPLEQGLCADGEASARLRTWSTSTSASTDPRQDPGCRRIE